MAARDRSRRTAPTSPDSVNRTQKAIDAQLERLKSAREAGNTEARPDDEGATDHDGG